jgi:predicted  nucleic acid-binding Zn-ribbon protein
VSDAPHLPAAEQVDDLHRLLAVQDLDTLADQLAARRRTLPERATLAAVEARDAALGTEMATRDGVRRKLLDEQERLEHDLAAADQRNADLSAKLKTIFVAREAEAVMAEQRTLAVRHAELEDLILEQMEQVAGLDDDDTEATAARQALVEEIEAAQQALAAAERDIDSQLAQVAARRSDALSGVPAAMLRRYEDLRRKLGGVAVARLEGGRCLGCHLALSTSELDRIRHEPADAIVECEHCSRLLVR